jgi:threonine dehydrogenase-like Zn-dependent dehydrogenase
MLETGRPIALREAMMACRNGGTCPSLAFTEVFSTRIPFGAVMNRSVTIKTGQTHVQRYMQPLLLD